MNNRKPPRSSMRDQIPQMTAEQLVQFIARDYWELSHDKIHWQRDDHMLMCREWLAAHIEDEEVAVVVPRDPSDYNF